MKPTLEAMGSSHKGKKMEAGTIFATKITITTPTMKFTMNLSPEVSVLLLPSHMVFTLFSVSNRGGNSSHKNLDLSDLEVNTHQLQGLQMAQPPCSGAFEIPTSFGKNINSGADEGVNNLSSIIMSHEVY